MHKIEGLAALIAVAPKEPSREETGKFIARLNMDYPNVETKEQINARVAASLACMDAMHAAGICYLAQPDSLNVPPSIARMRHFDREFSDWKRTVWPVIWADKVMHALRVL